MTMRWCTPSQVGVFVRVCALAAVLGAVMTSGQAIAKQPVPETTPDQGQKQPLWLVSEFDPGSILDWLKWLLGSGGKGPGGNQGDRDPHQGTPPVTAPEIDPGSMLGALTLLVGGALVLTDRRRSEKALRT